jgi:hypothetical protein
MVDGPDPGAIGPPVAASMENLRRIKSAVFFANFPRFRTIAITRNLSIAR